MRLSCFKGSSSFNHFIEGRGVPTILHESCKSSPSVILSDLSSFVNDGFSPFGLAAIENLEKKTFNTGNHAHDNLKYEIYHLQL